MRSFVRQAFRRLVHSPSRAEVVAWVIAGCLLTSGIAGGGLYLANQQTASTFDVAAESPPMAATTTTTSTPTADATPSTATTDPTIPDTSVAPTSTTSAAPSTTTLASRALTTTTANPGPGPASTSGPAPSTPPVTLGTPGGWPIPPTPQVNASPTWGHGGELSDSVTIDWSASSTGPNDVYRIKRADTGEVRVLTRRENLFRWDGLAPATSYTFVMWGENERGAGGEGSTTVRTHPDTAPRLTGATMTSSHTPARGDKVVVHVAAPNLAATGVTFRNAEGLTARCDALSADCAIDTTNLDAGRWTVAYVVFADATDRQTLSFLDHTTGYVNCFGPSTHGVDLGGLWFDVA
jgi:hypothetical protein